MKRTAFVAAAAALAAFPRAGQTQSLTKVRVSGSPDNDIVGALWGVQSGIFRKLGLDVEITASNSGGVVAAAVLGGALEIGKSSILGLVAARAKGVPFVIEAPASLWNTDAPTSALVVAKGSRIRAGADLNGKTISVPSLGDLYQIAINGWIDQHGGDSRTVKFLELPHRAAAEAIAGGRVDAANLAEPILSEALLGGKVQVIGHAQDAIGRHFIVTAYFCGGDYAAKNADVLGRFRKGLFEAAAYANANKPEMVPLLAKYSGVDAKVIAAMTPTNVGVAGQLDPRLIQPMIDAAVKYKSIPAPFPAKDMIDPNALNG